MQVLSCGTVRILLIRLCDPQCQEVTQVVHGYMDFGAVSPTCIHQNSCGLPSFIGSVSLSAEPAKREDRNYYEAQHEEPPQTQSGGHLI